jgi:hypothetical protein
MKKPKTPKKHAVALATSRTGRKSGANDSQASIVLKELTNFYLNSGDFNGIRALQLADRLGQSWPDWEPWDVAFKSLREVRRLRQQPAHAVHEDIFDQKYLKDQRQLIIDAYRALRTLRLMFMRDPKVKDAHIEISDWLARGLIWTY